MSSRRLTSSPFRRQQSFANNQSEPLIERAVTSPWPEQSQALRTHVIDFSTEVRFNTQCPSSRLAQWFFAFTASQPVRVSTFQEDSSDGDLQPRLQAGAGIKKAPSSSADWRFKNMEENPEFHIPKLRIRLLCCFNFRPKCEHIESWRAQGRYHLCWNVACS